MGFIRLSGNASQPVQPKDLVKVQPVPNTNLTINLDGQAIAKPVMDWITTRRRTARRSSGLRSRSLGQLADPSRRQAQSLRF